MMRNATISARKKLGPKTVVVLPVHYPRELFTAMDVDAVEMWGPPGPPRGPGAGRIPPYACAVVRNALAFLASGGADAAHAVSSRTPATRSRGWPPWRRFGGSGKPALRYLHPKGEDGPAVRAFVRAELEHLAGDLARLTGRTLETARLSGAIDLHARIDRLREELLPRRAFLDMTDLELYRLLRRGEFLEPGDHLAELAVAARGLAGERVQRGVPLMVTGYVPEPMTLFDSLASAGAFVAADDYAAVGRRVRCPSRRAAGSARHAGCQGVHDAAVPDPRSRSGRPDGVPGGPLPSIGGRRAHRSRAEVLRSGAFRCPGDPHPLRRIGAPLLYLEGELETSLSGQLITRLEAFLELVDSGRRIPVITRRVRYEIVSRAVGPMLMAMERWGGRLGGRRGGAAKGPFGPPLESTRKLKELTALRYLAGRCADGAVQVASGHQRIPGGGAAPARVPHGLPGESRGDLLGEADGARAVRSGGARGVLPRPVRLRPGRPRERRHRQDTRRAPAQARSPVLLHQYLPDRPLLVPCAGRPLPRAAGDHRHSLRLRRSPTAPPDLCRRPAAGAHGGRRADRRAQGRPRRAGRDDAAGPRGNAPVGRVPARRDRPSVAVDRVRLLLPPRSPSWPCAARGSATPTTGCCATS